MVSRRKGSIGRWLTELLISPTGGCRPMGLRYIVLEPRAHTEPQSTHYVSSSCGAGCAISCDDGRCL